MIDLTAAGVEINSNDINVKNYFTVSGYSERKISYYKGVDRGTSLYSANIAVLATPLQYWAIKR